MSADRVPLRERHARRGKVACLSEAELGASLPELPGWANETVDGHPALTKTLRFENFALLMVFVNRMAELAEAEDHHPDFSVHYNRLSILLWTHDAGGLTENDVIVAAKIDGLSEG